MSVAAFCLCVVVSEKALKAILDGTGQGAYRGAFRGLATFVVTDHTS